MNYTYDWTCTNNHGNTSSWDINADEIGADTLTNYCDVCGEEHTHTPLTVGQTISKIMSERPEIEHLFELLDAPHDMYSLGYIDNTLEQEVMSYLSDEKFLAVCACHIWVNKGSKDFDLEYTFNTVIADIIEELD